MHIIQCQNSEYRDEIISLYIEAFSSGLSQQHIDKAEIIKYIDAILLQGFTLLAIDKSCLLGALLACPLHFDKSLPDEIHQNFAIEICVYVAELMVVENARGQGIGRQLLYNFFDSVDKTLYSDAFIRVWDQNISALSLYQKVGFEPIASIDQTKIKADGSGTFVMHKIYLHIKLL